MVPSKLLERGIINDERIGRQVVHFYELSKKRVKKAQETQRHFACNQVARTLPIGQLRKLKLSVTPALPRFHARPKADGQN